MSHLELYRDDLLNRYASHTFTETTVGSMTQVEFKDGSSDVVGEATTLVKEDAYRNIRQALVGTVADVMFSITSTQRDAFSSVTDEVLIFQSTDGQVECFDGTVWEVVGGSEWILRAAKTVQTTDDTTTTIDSFTIDDEETYLIQITVVGTKSDGSERCGIIHNAVIYRDNGGSATKQGNSAKMVDIYSDSNWEVELTVSGDDVIATVTGVAATTINWKCSMAYIEQ